MAASDPGRRTCLLLFGCTAVVYAAGWLIPDVIDVDSAQYASIAWEMARDGSYLQVHHRGQDYLDKPPLLFWLAAAAFRALGASAVTFRLPSLLSTLLGVWATYGMARRLYSARAAVLAALLLATSQTWLLHNFDVRADTLLSNAVIFALWQWTRFGLDGGTHRCLLGALGVAAAMLAKGPIGLLVPLYAIGAHVALTGSWRRWLRWQWLLVPPVIAIALAPMVWGLWQQHGWRGPQFYFWTQSFGRITGSSRWRDSSTVFDFLATFLWAFWPWMLLAYAAMGRRLLRLWRQRGRAADGDEWLSCGGFVLGFLSLSLSRYKLPHYLMVLLPLAAVFTAAYLDELLCQREGGQVARWRCWVFVQLAVCAVLWVCAAVLVGWAFPLPWPLALLAVALCGATFAIGLGAPAAGQRLIAPSVVAVTSLNFLFLVHFVPQLLAYHSGARAADYVLSHPEISRADLFRLQDGPSSHAFDFHTRSVGRSVDLDQVTALASRPQGVWLFADDASREKLERAGLRIERSVAFAHTHVSLIRGAFLDPATREQAVDRRLLLKLRMPAPATRSHDASEAP
ncbi:MAG: glycosyltransferase family 39 protein [Deltaproteobacteria bacterium]|nr:glycosyltransferase family 39 protein [Deltaproteobacteria bacterium]